MQQNSLPDQQKSSDGPSPARNPRGGLSQRIVGLARRILVLRTLLALMVLFFGATLYVVYAIWVAAIPTQSDVTDPLYVKVEKGDTLTQVRARLEEAGLDVHPFWLRLAYRIESPKGHMKVGMRALTTPITHAELLRRLWDRPLLDQQVRIPDGAPIWRVRRIVAQADKLTHLASDYTDQRLAKKLGLPDGMALEGWFAPETYRYGSGEEELTVWAHAYAKQKKRLERVWATRPSDSILKSRYELLILASIIEKETGHAQDRALVSSVFHNRLRRGMPLQTDPTVIYGLGPNWNGRITKENLRTPTPYNTYTMKGLPPTPIAMPTVASLEAAMHPAQTDFIFFVAKGGGRSHFTTNLKDHNQAVQQYILNQKTP